MVVVYKKRKKGYYAGDANWRFDVKPFGSKRKMKATLIIKCSQCGGLMIAVQGQKSKMCPYCGVRVELLRAQKVASASNAFEASTMLKKLKREQGFTSKS